MHADDEALLDAAADVIAACVGLLACGGKVQPLLSILPFPVPLTSSCCKSKAHRTRPCCKQYNGCLVQT